MPRGCLSVSGLLPELVLLCWVSHVFPVSMCGCLSTPPIKNATELVALNFPFVNEGVSVWDA